MRFFSGLNKYGYARECAGITLEEMSAYTGYREDIISKAEELTHEVSDALAGAFQSAIRKREAENDDKFDALHSKLIRADFGISMVSERRTRGLRWICELRNQPRSDGCGVISTGHGWNRYIALENAVGQIECAALTAGVISEVAEPIAA